MKTESTKPSVVLCVEDLGISFRQDTGWQKAVQGVSFTLSAGESLGIVGESGSGKSVTSLSVMQLLPEGVSRRDSGSIVFMPGSTNERALHRMEEHMLRPLRGNRIAMIFQEPMTSLNPVMRCGRQVAESVRLHLGYDGRRAREYVLSLFREVSLPDPERIYRAYPHQLSGGQKQRVMIAMAVACRPDILIADEPTTALDVTVQKAILKLLKSLQAKYGMSLIFISHDLGVVAGIADRVLVMKDGQLVESGDVKTLFENPTHPYTRGLVACRPPLERRLRRLPVVADFTGPEGRGEHLLSESISKEERQQWHKELYSREPLLKVSGLSVHYPLPRSVFRRERKWFTAVDEVSFDVYPGETLGLVGESGCGKTTLGRAILRLTEPDSGSVVFEGEELTTLGQQALRRKRTSMQIIFQDPYSSLNPRITAGEAILEPMLVHGLADTRREGRGKVMELLERVGLPGEHYNRYPHQFSGGQRQRICIARALALNPRFIVCDESVSALDVSVQAQVLNLLNDLKRDFGFTYIFISHDLSVVKFMSDRMVVMKQGKIVESGEADSVYRNPSSGYTRELIEAIPGRESIQVL